MRVVVKEPLAERSGAVRGFDLHVDQAYPRLRFGGGSCLARRRSSRAQFGDQIQEAPLTTRRVGKDFLIEPFHMAKIEQRRPIGKEQAKELRQEFLEQGLEPLIVVIHRKTRKRSRAGW